MRTSINMRTYFRVRRAGQWEALDRVLDYLNTLDEQRPDKGELYKAIMEMRPR